jgi:hypothetical protein
MSDTTTPPRRRGFLFATWALASLAQFLIATNPGWFSHDELQWAVRADVARLADLPWFPWADLSPFQWRPLAFNAWLPLSWALFDLPRAWHALWVLAGSGLAVALAALLLRLGATTRVARGAALAAALGPYAVYVHGWVATIADLLWVGIALALAHALLTLRGAWLAAHPGVGAAPGAPVTIDPGARWTAGAAATTTIVAFAATALALAAKEAAVAIPALLVLCWALRPRERWLAWATGGAALAAAVYLALRLPVLLSGDGTGYAVDATQAPRNWLAYHLFVPRPSTFEVNSLWRASSWTLAVAGALWLGAWLALARADRRLALACVLGGAFALGPTLLLASSANQYGYAFSFWCVGCLALAWPKLRFGGRFVVWALMVLAIWHGANVQREMRRTGERQALFQPALVAALATHRGPLKLHAPDRDWLYRRLTTDVPAWHGHPIGDRVVWVASAAEADLVVGGNGQLEPPGNQELETRN